MNGPTIWGAWIGQKIVRCETIGDITAIVLEDGRAAKFLTKDIFYFSVKDKDGELWR